MLKMYIDKLIGHVCARSLFPEKPIIDFNPEVIVCCDLPLKVLKTRTKTAATLDIGEFFARETILECSVCGKFYVSDELQARVPQLCNFGYDVLVYVGKSLFLHNHNDKEIMEKLWAKNITISSSEIAYLAKKFIIYLALVHRQSHTKIKEALDVRGGYLLHLDATCEGDSPHLMSGLDEISEIVLHNVKISSESEDKIIPFLSGIKEAFGNPLALVHDMGRGILKAVDTVFPGILDFVCHFHFLRDLGKDLFGDKNDVIRNRLRHHGIQGLLQKKCRQLKKIIDQHPGVDKCLATSLEKGSIEEWALEQMPAVAAYALIQWALDGKKQGNGYGFPFDCPYLDFYQRLTTLYSESEKLQGIYLRDCAKDNKPFLKICRLLHDTINDHTLREATLQMQEKVSIFDTLRSAMRIAEVGNKQGLNDDGDDADIRTIEEGVKAFRDGLVNDERFSGNKDYQKVIRQIDKYWEKLFADPITVATSQGTITIQPGRTNNLLERFFRDIKRGYRKKSGTNAMSKTLKAMLADTPLVKNLENQKYLDIILEGKTTLEERFAEIDAKTVREELRKSQENSERIPPKIQESIKKQELPKNLVQLFKSVENMKSN